jgi:hypothetical protein
MFTAIELSTKAERAICMLVAAAIVAGTLLLGAYGAGQAGSDGYSVIVTQL